MTRFYRHDAVGTLHELGLMGLGMMRGLFSQGESIDSLINRAIEKLPKDAQGFVLEASVTPDVATVAVGFRFQDDWSVTIGADFRKDSAPAGHVEIIKTWN